MNTNTDLNAMIEKNWSEVKGKIKSKWDKINDEEIESVKSDLGQLSGKIQKAYGIAKEQADHQLHDFKTTLQPQAGLVAPSATLAVTPVTGSAPEPVVAKAKIG
jgi:uncharacterized protein YjbJ (UPF0337 family)